MRETKYWTWFMAAGLLILALLGLHMVVMHLGSLTHLFAAHPDQPSVAQANSQARDASLFFTLSYVVLLGAGLFHGLYGLRVVVFELSLKPAAEKALSALLLVVGLGLFGLGTYAAFAAHGRAAGASPAVASVAGASLAGRS